MKYLRIIRMGIKKEFTYNWAVFFAVLSSALAIIILDRFWLAIFSNDKAQYEYMINYSIVSRILTVFYAMRARMKIAHNIRSGDIAIQLTKPWNFLFTIFSEEIGGSISSYITKIVPISIISALLFWDSIRLNILALPAFLCSIVMSYTILFLLYAAVHMVAFWIIEASSLTILLGIVINFLSGQFLPTWIMPDFLKSFMDSLPFVWIYQKPIELFISSVNSTPTILTTLCMQLLWIIALTLICAAMWNKAVAKMVVQGG